jgi:hypothetical protein
MGNVSWRAEGHRPQLGVFGAKLHEKRSKSGINAPKMRLFAAHPLV